MGDSTQEERARRILGWLAEKREWTGNYDYFVSSGLYEGTITQMMVVDPANLPPLMSAAEIVEYIFRVPVLLQRVVDAGWLKPIPDLDEPYFSRDLANLALERLIKDEQPPRLQDEPELKKGELEIGNAQHLNHRVKAAKVAEAFGISVRSLHLYSKRGEVPCLKIGKHRLYNLTEVKEALERRADRGPLTEGDVNDILC